MNTAEQNFNSYWLHILRDGTQEPYTFTLMLSPGFGRVGASAAGAFPTVRGLAWNELESRLTDIGMKADKIASAKAQALSSGETVGEVHLDAGGLAKLGFRA